MSTRKSFIDIIPNLIGAGTVSFFVLSFLYNYIYFYYLDIDMELVPLTFSDYTLATPLYITLILPFFIGILFSKLNPKKADEIKKSYKYKKTTFFIVIFSFILLCSICYLIYKTFPITRYKFEPFLFIGLFFILYILDEYFEFLSFYLSCIIMSLSIFLGFYENVSTNIEDKFHQKNYSNEDKSLILIRTFEKGVLVSNKDYKISFRSLDGKNILNFNYNEELAEHLKNQTK